MNNKHVMEKELRPMNGILALLLWIFGEVVATVAFVGGILCIEEGIAALGILLFISGIVGWIVFSVLFGGLRTVWPNEARVLTLFGKYYGTIKTAGFYFVNPFSVSVCPKSNTPNNDTPIKVSVNERQQVTAKPAIRPTVSLKTQTLENGKQKVNDVLGNPIVIGAIVIWRVENPTEAVFAVENYKEYLSIQTDSIIRNTARLYPYDIFDDDDDDDGVKEKSLRGSSLEIAESMKTELQQKVTGAGLVIEEVRITHLAYAEEIAAAMLQRQQAAAVIAARQKSVDGAVGMVKMAIDKLGEDEIVVLDEERKAAMVSNLLVVLCGNKDAQPIVNSGSIY